MVRRQKKKVKREDGEMEIPPRPDPRKLPPACVKRLKKERLSKIEPKVLKDIMNARDAHQAKSTKREGPFYLSDDEHVMLLCWKSKVELTKLMLDAKWKSLCGDVRDQEDHILCGAYNGGDQVSLLRIINGLVDDFIPLSAWHLCSNVDPEMRGEDTDAKVGHVCYGMDSSDVLEYVRKEGVPEEPLEHVTFDCNFDPPESTAAKIQIDSILRFDTLDKALHHLHVQPIGASLIVFPEMWKSGLDIYYGPLTERSAFGGYHAVTILEVSIYKGEPVALCRMSNGDIPGDDGYIRVALSVLYMIVGATAEQAECVRSTPTPQHLLSNFHCPRMTTKQKTI